MDSQDCPGGPVVKNLPANGGGVGPIPDWETKILHATWYGRKIGKKKEKKYSPYYFLASEIFKSNNIITICGVWIFTHGFTIL